MSEYRFEQIKNLHTEAGRWSQLEDGIHIVLINAGTPPPHLLMLVHGAVYSLSVSGPRVNWPLEEFIALVVKKKMPALFVSLAAPASVLIKDTAVKEIIHDVTMINGGVRANEASCIFPIMEFCKTVYIIDISKVKVIFDLLDRLYDKKIVLGIAHLNMDSCVVDGIFKIKRYRKEEVNQYISNLKQ